MGDFQRGIDAAVCIYTAGVRFAPMPKLRGVPLKDAQELYSHGMLEGLEEIDAAHDPEIWRDSPLDRYIRSL